MKGFTWDSTEEFTVEHYRLIESICHLVVEDDEGVAGLAQDIWSAAISFAGRSPVSLCFDAVYIASNATGNKVSIPFLTYISEIVLQRRIKAMQSNKGAGPRWFTTEKGKNVLIPLLGDDEDLYRDCLGEWLVA
jgi:hypothetical protein|tara:strand:- start:6125 stop:6526 length:402 start_codon:yes stop_codon:yes gene_type:complete